MRRTRLALLSGLLILAAGCSDRATGPAPANTPTPNFDVGQGCLSAEAMHALIDQIFPPGTHRDAAHEKLNRTLQRVSTNPARARELALVLADLVLRKHAEGRTIPGPDTEPNIAALLNGVFCAVGLEPFPEGSLGPDGAATVVSPETPITTLVTETEWAGMVVEPGDVTTPTLFTIRRLPDFPSPLLTPFDTYPLYYEFEAQGAESFSTGVLVGACLANGFFPPDETRLRIAHNIAPYTWGSVEILPLEATPFLHCEDAGDIAAASFRGSFDLARGGVLLKNLFKSLALPEPLLAANRRRGGAGVGGTVRTFSPFGLVDTLGLMRPAVGQQSGYYGEPAPKNPAVQFHTPTGAPMLGITADFVVEVGGGSLSGTPATSGADGIASTTGWTFGFEPAQRVKATPRAPQGTGFEFPHVSFRATAGPRE